jgi:transcription elongation factor Elf1
MPDMRPWLGETPRATRRPRCPRCQSSMAVQRIVPARSGYEHWTLRCTRCGNIHQAQIANDPMKSDVEGWFHSELVPPK